MVDPPKKSTAGVCETIWEENRDGVLLDSRLAIYHQGEKWLALGDLHFGFEVSRRNHGALWPMWGRETIQARLSALLADYQPEILILNGDIVDSAAAGSGAVLPWLHSLKSMVNRLILIEGNHDRGAVIRELPFRTHFLIGRFLFHHGHRDDIAPPRGSIEVTGHVHPSVRLTDGAGLSLKYPCLIQEPERWILPAFSPWAGGAHYPGGGPARRWICCPRRILVTGGADRGSCPAWSVS